MKTPKATASKDFARALIESGVIPKGTTSYVIECGERNGPVMVTARYYADPDAVARLSGKLRERFKVSEN